MATDREHSFKPSFWPFTTNRELIQNPLHSSSLSVSFIPRHHLPVHPLLLTPALSPSPIGWGSAHPIKPKDLSPHIHYYIKKTPIHSLSHLRRLICIICPLGLFISAWLSRSTYQSPQKTAHFIDLNQKSPKNRIFFEKTSPKLLREWNIRITFALAFENEANAKSKAKEVESDRRKSSLKRLHKQRSSTRSKC